MTMDGTNASPYLQRPSAELPQNIAAHLQGGIPATGCAGSKLKTAPVCPAALRSVLRVARPRTNLREAQITADEKPRHKDRRGPRSPNLMANECANLCSLGVDK